MVMENAPVSGHWMQKDEAYIWHPFTPKPKSSPVCPAPIFNIVKGEGVYLYSDDGRRFFDGISSWWVNLHGHSHPYICQKIQEQLIKLDHVLFAGFTHPGALQLAERLLAKFPSHINKIFYSDNGSTAVEVAIKMALQYWYNKGMPRRKLVAFKGAYHGDTFGAMSVGDRGPFTRPFWNHLFEVIYIDPPVRGVGPEGLGTNSLEQMRSALKDKDVAAFIFEPLVQGAGGMVMQEPEQLSMLIKECKENGVLTIADEVMTGFGRTGKMFAIQHLGESEELVDLVCVSKGITGGTLPLGATLVSDEIHEVFVSDNPQDAFFHGHSYTANPISVAAALASLDLLEKEECRQQIRMIQDQHEEFQKELLEGPYFRSCLRDVRVQGTIFAMEMEQEGSSHYFHSIRDFLYGHFIERNLLLRPLGNVIYILPPYPTPKEELGKCYQAIRELFNQGDKTGRGE